MPLCSLDVISARSGAAHTPASLDSKSQSAGMPSEPHPSGRYDRLSVPAQGLLAGQGLCNEVIERQLFIAASTVNVHLSQVFTELGVTTPRRAGRPGRTAGVSSPQTMNRSLRALSIPAWQSPCEGVSAGDRLSSEFRARSAGLGPCHEVSGDPGRRA